MAPPAQTITAALDMSKAFDTINIHTLIRKLLQSNMPGTIIKFIENYIKGRTDYTTYIINTSSQRQFKTGVPQAGVLSPSITNSEHLHCRHTTTQSTGSGHDLRKNVYSVGTQMVPTTPACTRYNRPEEDLPSGKLESTHPSRTVVVVYPLPWPLLVGGVRCSRLWSTSQLLRPSGQQCSHSGGVCPQIQGRQCGAYVGAVEEMMCVVCVDVTEGA